MSWLEYLGLEYLFSKDSDHIYDGLTSGLLLILGVGIWLLITIFKGDLIDKGAVVFNLFAALILLILSIIKYYRNYKNTQNVHPVVKIYYLISIIVIVASFIFGFIKTYHALIFNYEYKGLFSCLAWTFYPLIILNLLYPFFCENNHLGIKIQEGFETIGLSLIILVALFFIGQIVSVILYFTECTNIYDKIVTYHDLSIKDARIGWNYSSCEDYINQSLPVSATNLINQYTESNSNISRYKYLINNYPSDNGNYKNNGLVFNSRKFISDSIVVYDIIDKEYYIHYYVKFDYDTLSILNYITFEEYSNIEIYKE